jgi:hypothetical protein
VTDRPPLPDATLARLPKGVQDYIATLQRDIEYREETIRQMAGRVAASRVHLDVPGADPVPVPESARLLVYPDEIRYPARVEDYVEVRLVEERPGVEGTGRALAVRGGRALAVEPISSNSINVRLRDR